MAVATPAGRKCIAQASYKLDQVNESLTTIRGICAVVLVVVLIVAILVGRFLARRSLRPVQSITATAERIGVRGLGERIPLAGTNDEIDRLATTLNKMLERIERFVRQMQQFTADASHELRTPLAALRGSAEVALSQKRSTDELRQTLEEGISQYERLQRVAEDLLLLTRLDAGEVVMRREAVVLCDSVADVVDLYAPLAEEKGLSLGIESCDKAVVQGDDGRLRQVVGNLLDNSIKYTPPSGRISVSVAKAHGNARIQVKDSGIGIAANELSNVFNRFYRVDSSRSAVTAPGTGLGLSICQSIVEAHGGSITIESTPMKGTCVTVLLPADGFA